MKRPTCWLLTALGILSLTALVVSGCRSDTTHEDKNEHASDQARMLTLPELAAVDLDGAPLKVVATTSIIGDVVAQVEGGTIELITLMEPGQDPHSYEPTPQEMAAVSQAHVVFVNGWDLEEGLARDLQEIAQDVSLVPISAYIEPLAFGETAREHTEGGAESDKDEHAHAGADPHVWFDIHNVEQWVENVVRVLSDLDPTHAETYESNAEAYRTELAELAAYAERQLSRIPAEQRYLVTNHDSFGYLAHAYDLRVLGTVLPAASTVAEPSASDLAALIEEMEAHGLCTLFTEATVGDRLAQTVAAELEGCDEVWVLKVFTGAIGPAGSGADSYVGMFRHNVDTIVAGLQ
jgi:ABC-type Zn uptake system ZnuABC Zn-binding protein ZnuA